MTPYPYFFVRFPTPTPTHFFVIRSSTLTFLNGTALRGYICYYYLYAILMATNTECLQSVVIRLVQWSKKGQTHIKSPGLVVPLTQWQCGWLWQPRFWKCWKLKHCHGYICQFNPSFSNHLFYHIKEKPFWCKVFAKGIIPHLRSRMTWYQVGLTKG